MVECLTAVGAPNANAKMLADVLVSADKRGHHSHGLNRFEMYVREIKNKLCNPAATPEVIKNSPSTAWVDGNNGLGPVVGNFCMDLAIEKARATGAGVVVAKGSNHYGMAAWYSMQALKHNMLGVSLTNTSPLMSPTRSKVAALGTNPISVAAPGLSDDSFVLDMATTSAAVGKIELKVLSGQKIPSYWALGPDGHPTTDARVAFETGCLMPLGGTEENSGYKGYGLALMVDVLCGVLGGGCYGNNIRKWKGGGNQVANLGQFFMAINLSSFAPDFNGRLSDILTTMRNLPQVTEKPVLVHGDPEKANEKAAESTGYVPIAIEQIEDSAKLADELQIPLFKMLEQ